MTCPLPPSFPPSFWRSQNPRIGFCGGCRLLTVFLFTIVGFALGLVPLGTASAQEHENALSNAEVETLRDTAYYPPQRVEAFVGFLNQRTEEIEKLSTGKRKPGREEDIHDQMEQWTSIASDLDDNLDEYGKRHKDIRKALPKLLNAIERWNTVLRTPPDNPEYSETRKLALESLDDLRESAKKLVEDQKAWFAAHPPNKDDGKNKEEPHAI
jgi:hypothetical protein